MSLDLSSLAKLPAVSLTDLDSTWTTPRRYDTKFIAKASAVDAFLSQASMNFAALEVNEMRSFTYQTTYFDTPDLLLYRDHAQRRRRRIKVRIRNYVESNRTRLEVKAKLGNGQTQKALFEGHQQLGPSEVRLVNDAVVTLSPSRRYREIAERLQPTAITTFQRSTIINQDVVERITIDSVLVLEAATKRVEMLPDLVVVEIKSLQRTCESVRQFRQMGLHPTSFSKYCAAIETTQDLRPKIHSANKLDHILRPAN